ncbi:hypothetical protein TMEN_3559 [Trichophyton mentagrophytes]|uniref:Uncharacterized protein n=1 Tax=Trichophyton interdigitale (strain MR816) TaxID=1215338 RepID=A0A059IYR3_TRIIM|nr:hypothetical protein H109_07331 [Trichophyton interdigitale MR816]GBF61091.1 hypothetical protein TMEN_3559 [Trichophyton mentagrophytes]
MAPRNYSELGRSLGLLGDQLPWYWKVVSVGSAWSLLTGFILFPFAMEPNGAELGANKNALLGTAVILLTLAYLLSALYYVRWRRSIYLFNSLFFACFTSSILGMFNVVINILVRKLLPMSMLSTIIVAISCVSTAAYGLLAFYFSDYWLSVTCSRQRRRARTRAASEVAPDDTELQRRQLLRLYLRPDRAPSVELSQSTFRIDLPDHQSAAGAEEEMLVTPPQNAYERSLYSVSAPSNYPSEVHSSPTSAYKLNPLRYWQPQRSHRDQMRPLAELIS